MKRFLISTGDHSADIHGENLVRALKQISPVHVTALGGSRLRGVSDYFLHDMVQMDVSGFTQPIKQFFTLRNILRQKISPLLSSKKIDAVILIDYYGFNIHVAQAAWEQKIPVFYFVSPQVWASRKWRIQKLKKYVERMLVIFPFEEELYKSYGVPVSFVGNPLMDTVSEIDKKFPQRNMATNKIRLGLMPGSRRREILYHLPILLESFKRLLKQFPNMETVLFEADSVSVETYQNYIASLLTAPEQAKLMRLRNASFEDRLDLTLSLTASGTVTLENALLGIPMIVFYRTSYLTYSVAKRIIQVPFISMPNILSGQAIVPELIQDDASVEKISGYASEYLTHPERLKSMRENLLRLKQKLGVSGAYHRAAEIILTA